ncbi:MAG TPA: xanthine dehydrogenase family protein subunit M [Thermoanaerobaculia bacterium]|nr:xanthine dehydrogenase family protein subunit M [Thermoanaerobaculia bacterium]
MRNFAFHRPQSLAEAVALLGANDGAKLLAGGQSLLPVLKLGLAEPPHLVSLAGIRGLWGGISSEGGELVIGALATHDEVSASPEVRRRIPGLAALAAGIGDVQVRNRGTLGGSLAHADPAADYPAAVLALGAMIATDRRRIAADDFFTGLFATALAPDEIITAVRFPVPECCAYAKFPHRASKYALVGVMVAKTAGGVRVAVTGAGARAFRAPALEAALGVRFAPDALGNRAQTAVKPEELRSDGEASAEYRAHLVTVMAKRAVQACL